MKRSAAPRNTHPSGASKKTKPTKVVESSVVMKEIKPLKVVAKSGPPPPLAAHHDLDTCVQNTPSCGNTEYSQSTCPLKILDTDSERAFNFTSKTTLKNINFFFLFSKKKKKLSGYGGHNFFKKTFFDFFSRWTYL